ncbi:hypothetical protein H4R33_004148 [Dimargaris cristalligena]|nr:hypothetical protein H4R33_004148 [Dimargaris cristalligena]
MDPQYIQTNWRLGALYTLELILSAVCLAGNMVHITHNVDQTDVLSVASAVMFLAASFSSSFAMLVLFSAKQRIVAGHEFFAERTLLGVVSTFYIVSGLFVVAYRGNPCAVGSQLPVDSTRPSVCGFHYLSLVAGLLAWLSLAALLAFNVYRARCYVRHSDTLGETEKQPRIDSLHSAIGGNAFASGQTDYLEHRGTRASTLTYYHALQHHRLSNTSSGLRNSLYHSQPMP